MRAFFRIRNSKFADLPKCCFLNFQDSGKLAALLIIKGNIKTSKAYLNCALLKINLSPRYWR